jgi:hypothetical protein
MNEESRLLVEAVSLLLEREREIEATLTDRFHHAERHAARVERGYAEVEARVHRIEKRLAELAPSIDPRSGDLAVLAQIRGQLTALAPPAGPAAAPEPLQQLVSVPPSGPPPVSPTPPPPPSSPATHADTASASSALTTSSADSGKSPWSALGDTREARFGALLMAAGAIALLYIILTQAGLH